MANGVPLPGAFEAEVGSNNHYAADHFSVGVALSADPSRGAAWWAAQDSVLIDIEISLGGGYQRMLRGAIDTIEVEPLRNVLRMRGRDLSAGLIEARTQETFANRTSSEIATILAGRHGLDADAQATTTPVGCYWQLEHDRIVLGGFARATTEWDLLVALAQYEGFDVWVSGTTLCFRAPDPPTAPLILQQEALISLRIERALTLACDIEVTVKSWHSRTAHSYVQTARTQPSRGAPGQVKRYVYIVPNLTPDEALKLAQRRLAELTRHERVVVAEMPGELSLAPRQQILLQGTGTEFDRTYWLDAVVRRFTHSGGFTQRLHARNAGSPGEATAPADKVIAVWTGS
jgi:phage protein D